MACPGATVRQAPVPRAVRAAPFLLAPPIDL